MKNYRFAQISKLEKILLIRGRKECAARFKANKDDFNNVLYVLRISTIIRKCHKVLRFE